ncbi:carbon storage regulator [bacterium]|jgi:carbon storage regulator|nr:carbon storage regulator [bacterium]
MLVVTRKLGEEVIINDEIRVQVVDVRPGRVKLGVVAPTWMSVHRGEVQAQQSSSEADSPELPPPTINAS